MTKFLTAAVAALLFSGSAFAQSDAFVTLTDFSGKVLVNQGGEFVPATKGMVLKPGDRIMVQGGADAKLVFGDECADSVQQNKIYTVPEKSVCAGGNPVVQDLKPTGGNAIGDTAGGSTGTGNGGVLAMAAIVAAIDIWWLNEDDSDIVSP